MKLSTKKVFSLALAGAIALTSVFTGSVADAAKVKKAAAMPTAKLEIQAQKDAEVSGSVVVSGVAVSVSGSAVSASGKAVSAVSALSCKYDASLASSIATASAVVATGDAVKVTVTATKGAGAVSGAAVSVLSGNTQIANVLVTIKAPAVKKATKSIAIKDKVVIARGKSKKVAFTVKKTAAADTHKAVKVSSSNEKVVQAKKVAGKKKVQLTVPSTAKMGASAKVTVKSGNKTATIKVYVKNPAQKVKAKKSVVTVKKGASKNINVLVTAKNKAKATTDDIKVTSSKKKLVKVTSSVAKKGKAVIKIKAKKKGISKLTVQVGSKKTAVTVRVK